MVNYRIIKIIKNKFFSKNNKQFHVIFNQYYYLKKTDNKI